MVSNQCFRLALTEKELRRHDSKSTTNLFLYNESPTYIINSTTADTMVVVPESINQYPNRKRFFKISNTVFLWILEESPAPYIRNLNPSLLIIYPIHKYQINTLITIPGVAESVPATPGHIPQITSISTTKIQSAGRCHTAAVSRPSSTPYTISDTTKGP